MCRLIAAPSGWIERDNHSFVRRFFVDDPQQVMLTQPSLCHPSAESCSTDQIRFADGPIDHRFGHLDAVLSQERKLDSGVRGEPYGFVGHSRSLPRCIFGRNTRDDSSGKGLRRHARPETILKMTRPGTPGVLFAEEQASDQGGPVFL